MGDRGDNGRRRISDARGATAGPPHGVWRLTQPHARAYRAGWSLATTIDRRKIGPPGRASPQPRIRLQSIPRVGMTVRGKGGRVLLRPAHVARAIDPVRKPAWHPAGTGSRPGPADGPHPRRPGCRGEPCPPRMRGRRDASVVRPAMVLRHVRFSRESHRTTDDRVEPPGRTGRIRDCALCDRSGKVRVFGGPSTRRNMHTSHATPDCGTLPVWSRPHGSRNRAGRVVRRAGARSPAVTVARQPGPRVRRRIAHLEWRDGETPQSRGTGLTDAP